MAREMWASNLAIALEIAIENKRRYERTELGYTSDSALVAGWQEILDGIKQKEDIIIKHSIPFFYDRYVKP